MTRARRRRTTGNGPRLRASAWTLRPAHSMATSRLREHQRPAAAAPAQGGGLVELHPRPARRHRRQPDHPAARHARLGHAHARVRALARSAGWAGGWVSTVKPRRPRSSHLLASGGVALRIRDRLSNRCTRKEAMSAARPRPGRGRWATGSPARTALGPDSAANPRRRQRRAPALSPPGCAGAGSPSPGPAAAGCVAPTRRTARGPGRRTGGRSTSRRRR